jgi:NAD(P)-dependent dehydrogenase (short-subunit alcohol dehydrogenase family)
MNTVIIGATGGIGAATARTLPGPHILAARDAKALRELANAVGGVAVPTDVTRELEVQALAAEAESRGGVGVLVYAAGTISPASLTEASASDLERVWSVNYLGAQLVLKHLGPLLTPDARVFLLGARPELVEFKNFSGYASSKAALSSLARIAALELKRPVTLVLPGPVDTAFWARLGRAPKNAISPQVVADAIRSSLETEAVSELRV